MVESLVGLKTSRYGPSSHVSRLELFVCRFFSVILLMEFLLYLSGNKGWRVDRLIVLLQGLCDHMKDFQCGLWSLFPVAVSSCQAVLGKRAGHKEVVNQLQYMRFLPRPSCDVSPVASPTSSLQFVIIRMKCLRRLWCLTVCKLHFV